MDILIIILLILGVIGLIQNPAGNGGALFLGAIALSAPYIVEWLKKKCFAPDLHIEYIHEPPYFRQTRPMGGLALYYSQFSVENKGKSQAKSCEAVLEELWLPNSRGKLVKEKNFLPINLEWAMYHQQPDRSLIKSLFEDINPERKKYCNIGHIRHSHDATVASVFYIGSRARTDHRFFFEISPRPHAQPDCIFSGKSKIRIGIYADNAPKITKNFTIEWSGKWEDKEEDMLKEFKISVQGEQKGKGGDKG